MSRGVFLVIVGIFVLAGGSANAEMLKVERVWEDTDIDYGYALVTFTNTTQKTFKRVTIQCAAIGPNGKKLNIGQHIFSDFRDGAIKPGFNRTVRISVQLYKAKMKSMSYTVF